MEITDLPDRGLAALRRARLLVEKMLVTRFVTDRTPLHWQICRDLDWISL